MIINVFIYLKNIHNIQTGESLLRSGLWVVAKVNCDDLCKGYIEMFVQLNESIIIIHY